MKRGGNKAAVARVTMMSTNNVVTKDRNATEVLVGGFATDDTAP